MTDSSTTSSTPHAARKFLVVAIGASAGGLEAFRDLLKALPADTGMGFVFVQHLEPHHDSQLTNILSSVTSMVVREAEQGVTVEPNQLYVIPPNKVMVIAEGVLHLSPRLPGPGAHYPIDQFFFSLAEDRGNAAVGVVLSGSGSDGARGLQAIKNRLGTTFVQDIESAKYASMPHCAIATGAVDFILPPDGIARELARLPTHPFGVTLQEEAEAQPEFAGAEEELTRVFGLLKATMKVDFSQYKQSTIRRRIARRMVVHNVESLRAYCQWLESDSTELSALYRDLLINVTSFFREPEMYETLPRVLLPSVRDRSSSEALRIWIPGCSTGEEVYSMAIIVAEMLSAESLAIPVQFFGTDVSDTAIDRARAAVYPESIQKEMSPERLRRFFIRADSGYRVSPSLREWCVFARHDLTADPPFSQLDLVSCRNLLIYLDSLVQKRILPALHYSLKPGGLLVLGSAETIGARSDLFAVVDNEHRIYSKRVAPSRFLIDFPARAQSAPTSVPSLTSPVPLLSDIEARAARLLRDIYAPPAVIVNEDMQVLHFHGDTSPFLQPPEGEATLNMLRLARESVLHGLRQAIDSATVDNSTSVSGVRVDIDGTLRQVGIRVIPLAAAKSRYFVVVFEHSEHSRAKIAAESEHISEISDVDAEIARLRRELGQAREYLRNMIEQHEVATEELKAVNEEAQSSNEELQSTNEELRTAKEELQSSNEELITVNEELTHRNDELNAASSDLSNVLSAANIPIFMVDMDFRLRRFTPGAERLLGLTAADLGRTVTDISSVFNIPDLKEMLATSIDTLAVQERRAQNLAGRWYSVHVRPYRTIDDRINGAVVTFIDIDDLMGALARAERARDFAEGIVESVQHPLLVLDAELHIQRATAAFYRLFQVRPEDIQGKGMFDLRDPQWNLPPLRLLLEEALVRDSGVRDVDFEVDIPGTGRRTLRFNARRIASANGKPHTLLVAIEDITERKEAAEIRYRRLFETAKDGILILDADSGRVLDVNPYFAELSRYPRQELIGKPFWELAPFLDAEEGRRLVPEARLHESIRYESTRLVARDRSEYTVELVANRYTVKGQILIQINVRDVTEKRRAEESVRRSNLDLQQFAFAASHDLQEPLRTITSYLQLVEQELSTEPGERIRTSMQFITEAAGRMRQMLYDLLAYTRVAREETASTPVRAEVALSAALLNLQMAIHQTDARITFDPLPTVAMAETHLVQLLQNLVGNALKYRGERIPEIHVSAQLIGQEWVFSIRDNGVGIDPRFREQIFTVFKRLHGREQPGTGIGLAISKRIVERYGGRIWVESEPGAGSTFYFTVPQSV